LKIPCLIVNVNNIDLDHVNQPQPDDLPVKSPTCELVGFFDTFKDARISAVEGEALQSQIRSADQLLI
jgi:hypothetical protein